MSIYVKVNDNQYPASIQGRICDTDWNGRDSKLITLNMSHDEVKNIFTDDIDWFIVQDNITLIETINEETGEVYQEMKNVPDVFDNSEYSIAGDIIDHRDGTTTVKMGKPTAEELLTMIVEGLSL